MKETTIAVDDKTVFGRDGFDSRSSRPSRDRVVSERRAQRAGLRCVLTAGRAYRPPADSGLRFFSHFLFFGLGVFFVADLVFDVLARLVLVGRLLHL